MLLMPTELDAWGWRLPFIFGLLLAPVGLYLRNTLDETPAFIASRSTAAPAIELTGRYHALVELFSMNQSRFLCRQTKLRLALVTFVMAGVVHVVPS